MKKILLSTALLSATAGMAAAEVSFSGYGRFGLEYVEGRSSTSKTGVETIQEETQISMRLRFNINAKTETDSGVTFGGRIRMQYTDGATAAGLNAAYVYAEYEGLRVEVGNSNTAYDSAALMYNSEMGFLDSSNGDPIGSYFGYSSGAYSGTADRMGIFAAYGVGDLKVRLSYVTPDQATIAPVEDEVSISADYKFGAITVSAAYATNGSGIDGNDLAFVGAEYAVNDSANVGLLYFKTEGFINGPDGTDVDILNDEVVAAADLVTLYGNYAFDAITAKAYIAFSEDLGTEDTAYGIGADYDLGGARLSGSLRSNFDGDMGADVGVRFDF